MSYRQVTQPRLGTTDYAGWCLRFTQYAYDAPAQHETAWIAWQAQRGRHTNAHPRNVSVPVWFSHWGTYNGHYRNWGHVVPFVPGRGYLSSPGFGHGQAWFQTIAQVEAYFGAKYVGWSEYLNGKQIVRRTATSAATPTQPIPKGPKTMAIYKRADKRSASGRVLKPGGSFYLFEGNGKDSNATNIVGGVGEYTIAVHVYAKGAPGEGVDVQPVWQNQREKPRRNSNHYVERMVFDQTGTINRTVTFVNDAEPGDAVFVRAVGPSSNKQDARLSLFRTSAQLSA